MIASEIEKLQEIEDRFYSVIAYNHDIPDDNWNDLNDLLTEIGNMIKSNLFPNEWEEIGQHFHFEKLFVDTESINFPSLLSKLWYIGDSIKFFLRRK